MVTRVNPDSYQDKNNCCNIGCKFDSQIDTFSIKNVVRKLLTDHSKSESYQYFYTIIYQYLNTKKI